MKLNYHTNWIEKTGTLIIVSIFAFLVLAGTRVEALTDHLVFSVNGDTTAVSMVQGDSLGWGANCAVGALLTWEIWYDLNGNSTINDPGDKLVFIFAIADGDTNSQGPPPDNNPIPDGWFMTPPMLLGIAPGVYIFRVTDQSDATSTYKAITVTELLLPPNSFSGQLTIPGHPAPDAAALKNHWIEANLDNEMQMWSAFTNDSGKFTINVGSEGTGLTFNISPPSIPGYVTPPSQSVAATGNVALPDFAYESPSDSVYGTVKDDAGLDLTVQPWVYASPQFGGNNKETQVVGGNYALYFGPTEGGVWWIGVATEMLIPYYMAPVGHAIDNSTTHGIQYNIVCPKADTTVYVRVTENGAAPAHAYHVQVSEAQNGYFTEGFTGVGAGNIVPLHVSHLYDTGWYAMVATWDTLYPIPANLVLDGTSNHSFGLGDTITLNFISGKAVSDTVTVDAGDPIPNWDSVWVGLCNVDGCSNATIDPAGVFTVYADTGDLSLNVFSPGYLSDPSYRNFHLLNDTAGGLGFLLNQTHCRISGSLDSVPLPLSSPTWVSAHTTDGSSYSASAQVDMITGTYEFYLCDGDWSIDPPFITDRVSPGPALLTIGEAPDTARTQDFEYAVFSDVGGDPSTTLPTTFGLEQNYPNPFNPSTNINFSLPTASDYKLTIYNVSGQMVEEFSGHSKAGIVSLAWDGSKMASGVYLYRLTAGDFTETKKMMLLK